jgi:hypothetical protein
MFQSLLISAPLVLDVTPGISDHNIVYTEMNMSSAINTQKPRKIPIYRKAKWDSMKEDVVIHGSLSFPLHTLCRMCLLTLASMSSFEDVPELVDIGSISTFLL